MEKRGNTAVRMPELSQSCSPLLAEERQQPPPPAAGCGHQVCDSCHGALGVWWEYCNLRSSRNVSHATKLQPSSSYL